MVQACDEVQLSCSEREAGFLQLNGDGHLTRASVHWKMRDLGGGGSVNSGEFPIKMHKSQRGWCHTTYLRYRFGCEDPKAPGGVLGRIELPAAEVELIG